MTSFSNQIQSEYYGRNRSISIEVITLETFSAPQQTIPLSEPGNLSLHYMFHSFLSDDSKKYAAHSKHIVEFLKNRQLLFYDLSKIWDNSDVCA